MKQLTIQLQFSGKKIELKTIQATFSEVLPTADTNAVFKVNDLGQLLIPETAFSSRMKFPFPVYLFVKEALLGKIFIPDQDSFGRAFQDTTAPIEASKVLTCTLDLKTGNSSSEFLTPIKLNPVEISELSTATSLLANTAKPTKLRGKIANLDAKTAAKNVQVILFGVKRENKEALPVALGVSDSNGNLVFDYPKGMFQAAYAIVSTAVDAKLPINLNVDGTFPDFILLVGASTTGTGAEEEAHEDCGCSSGNSTSHIPRLPDTADLILSDNYSQDIGGSCTNFTTPNRALEEFSYFRIVRTTDPTIITPEDTMALQAIDEQIKKITKDIYALEKAAFPVSYETANPKSTAANKVTQSQTALTAARQLLAQKRSERNALVSRLSTRKELSVNNLLDWDDTPTTFQNTSIAHGHILEFRQVWKADGYSMGDLLYSLPLAPGQKRQIAVYDWDRYDQAQRIEDQTQSESLSNEQSRDRDINEIVSSVLNESQEADSQVKGKTTSWGVGVSVSTPTPVSVGVSGSFSMSNTNMNTNASQSSSRDLAGSSLQQIKDKTMQKASSIRSSRATVIQAVNQGESMSARTEVVANYNHCHAITIQYFEVLRHFAVANEIADVKECLFIPLPITPFDDAKVIRWEDILRRALPNRMLLKAFESVRRYHSFNAENVADAYASFPNARYCDERLKSINVKFKLDVYLNRPEEIYPTNTPSFSVFITSIAGGMSLFGNSGELKKAYEEERTKHLVNNQADIDSWGAKLGFVPGWTEIRRRVLASPYETRDVVFQREMDAVDWLSFYVKNLVVSCFFPALNNLRFPLTPVSGQLKILSRTNNGPKNKKMSGGKIGEEIVVGVTNIDVSQTVLTRAHFSQVEIFHGTAAAPTHLSAGSFVRLVSGTMDYVTPNFKGNLFTNYTDVANLALGEKIAISTPLNTQELVNPRIEDIKLRDQLIQHLNANLEAYHHWIFYMMSPDRRYMLLDGLQIKVPGRKIMGTNNHYPDEMRSVASVVENRVIGVVGNNIIMPVASGYNLDPLYRFDEDEVKLEDGTTISTLMHHYMPTNNLKTTPFRISVPTKGVFAESVMGACNSCERIDNTRFWKWEEHPIPDDPTAIGPINTDSRYQSSGDLSAKDFADALIALKDPQAAPDPTGLATALNNVVKGDSFRDITGLAGLQDLAKQGILTSAEAAKHYSDAANQMATLASNQQNSDNIQKSIKSSNLDPEVKKKLMEEHLRNMISGNGGEKDKTTADAMKEKLVDHYVGSGKGKLNYTSADGESIDMEVEDANPKEEEPEEEEHTPAPGEPAKDLTEEVDLTDPDFVASRQIIDQTLNDMAGDLGQFLAPFASDSSTNTPMA